MKIFTKIYRLSWLLMVILIVFFDRNNTYQSWFSIVLLLVLSFISVLRFLESRNEWRRIINEESLDKYLP